MPEELEDLKIAIGNMEAEYQWDLSEANRQWSEIVAGLKAEISSLRSRNEALNLINTPFGH